MSVLSGCITKKHYYFPPEVWEIITSYLGENYWDERIKLTYISQALDFAYSDYNINSYWKWYKWRQRSNNSWYLDKLYEKPETPLRFNKIKNNPYIMSVDPPKLTFKYEYLRNLHRIWCKKVFFCDEMEISNR